jgi:ABC-type Zn uptake system ZnuABC Zn-binding protein ZnuA
MTARVLIATLVLALAAAACGEEDNAGGAGDRITVVATTTQAADLVRNVGGDRVEVVGLLAANTDPHDYEPRPRDAQALADAELIVRSGGELDAWLQPTIEGAGSDAPVLTLIDAVRTLEREDAEHGVDPHWWQDPRNAVLAVGAIRDALLAADPAGAAAYRQQAGRYAARLRALDRAVQACLDGVPEARRKLVTTHDALGYYARRYGIEVIGTVIPSLTTEAQPSAGDTAELVRTIRAAGVTAIFAESSVSPKVEQAIAREAGARVGKALWADSLGPSGSGGETYARSIAANTRALLDGFTDGERTCSLPS